MHIAVNGWFWNRPETGSGQYTRQLVKQLPILASDCHVTVFVPCSETQLSHTSPYPDTVQGYTIRHISSGTSSLHKVLWEQVHVPHLARAYGANILHIPYWAPPVRSRLPFVVTIHDLIPVLLPAYRGSILVRLYTALVSAATRGASMVITDSDASRRDILANLHIPDEKVRTVHLAADEQYTALSSHNDKAILQHYGLPESYVLYLGGFDSRKNLALLLQAFSYVLQCVPGAKLVIAGKLPTENTFFAPDPRLQARNAGLPAGAVIFPGFIDEAHKAMILRGASVFVFPSLYEGFGLPPLEAMQCGVPVVGSNRSSLPEVVQHGGTLVEPDDIQGMAGAIIQLLVDGEYRAVMGKRAIEQARHFSWQKTAAKTYEIFSAVID